MRKAFSLIELIFIIVIIGILAMVALPKFRGVTANSKVSAELATASTIQSAIEDVHSDWIVSESDFSWGNGKTLVNLNDKGYPKQLGECSDNKPFNWILKNSVTVDSRWECKKQDSLYIYRGPASKSDSGVNDNGEGKPDSDDCWVYDPENGTFELKEGCNI